MTDTHLYQKLAKMLRLASNEGATEGERDAAMARAQDIAFRYNIDLQNVAVEDPEVNVINQTEQIVLENWQGTLLTVVARMNFCDVFFIARQHETRRWVVFGKTHNIDASMALFQYLRDQLVREATREVSRRDKRAQYARMCLIELARDLVPTAYMQRVLHEEDDDALSDAPFFGPDQKIVNINHDRVIDAALDYLNGNDHLLRGAMGLKWIMDRTGLTMAYASEIRPYLRRGEIAPEIVKDLGVWRSSFYMGATWTIADRLREHFKDLVEDAGAPGQELVRKEDAGLKEYEESLGLGKEQAGEKKWDLKGAASGVVVGNKVNIHNRQALGVPHNILEAGK